MFKLRLVVSLFLCSSACADPYEAAGEEASGSGETSATTMETGALEPETSRGFEPGESSSTGSLLGTTGTTDTADGSTSGDTTGAVDEDGTDDSDDTPSLFCTPVPADDACMACTKTSCCDEIEACIADGDATQGCLCFVLCQNSGGGLLECRQQCNVPLVLGDGPTASLTQCTLTQCASECFPSPF